MIFGKKIISSMLPGADQAGVNCVEEMVEDIVAVNSSDLDNPKSEILQILLQQACISSY